MIKQSITITERNKDWLDAQVASGRFGNVSEVVRALIREHEDRQDSLRAALELGEKSGPSPLRNDERLAWIKAQLNK
ncbi:MAG: type II toxin-antitoxin system ParD family antitoxin [Pseudomonadota bacterium]